MKHIALDGARGAALALSGTRAAALAMAGTVYGFVSAVLTPWLLDFSTEDHSSYVALL